MEQVIKDLPHTNRPIEGGFRSTVGEYITAFVKNKGEDYSSANATTRPSENPYYGDAQHSSPAGEHPQGNFRLAFQGLRFNR